MSSESRNPLPIWNLSLGVNHVQPFLAPHLIACSWGGCLSSVPWWVAFPKWNASPGSWSLAQIWSWKVSDSGFLVKVIYMVIIPHWHRRKSASIYLSAQCLTLHRQPRSTPPRTSLINRRNPRFHSLFPLVYSPIIRNPPRKSNTNGGSSGKGSSPSANMRLRMRWHGMIGLQLGVHIYKEYSYFGKNTKEHYY